MTLNLSYCDLADIYRDGLVRDRFENDRRVNQPHLSNVMIRLTWQDNSVGETLTGQWIDNTGYLMTTIDDVDIIEGDRVTNIRTNSYGILDTDTYEVESRLLRRGRSICHKSFGLRKID